MNRTILTTAILAALSFPAFAADDHAGHDHAGHDHGHEKAAAPGSVVIGGVTITVSGLDKVAPGKTVELHLAITPDTPAPKAIRAWVGIESGKGSAKGKAHLHGADSHVDVEVPSPLPEGSALWIQVDPAEGAAGKASMPLVAAKKADK